ncbi:phage tail sheath C-terminal domain-containing protein [Novosphingobium profundi]|uniref:phage tail sheath C-terminal domain-containing protein n=1 Tax=Novosphingobium profundi TaxID=1774954 RepID=UPI001CFDEF39|nr:phage tail sheath C-terminal domain-containing protein [Novosphingobium profundi]
MLQPTYPGVYTRELPSGVRTISGAPTSVALFVGPTRSGIDLRPVRIRNFGDFERQFGGLAATSSLSYSVMHFFGNGGGEAFVMRVPVKGSVKARSQIEQDGTNTAAITLEALGSGAAGGDILVTIDDFGIDAAPLGGATAAQRKLFNLTLVDTARGTSEFFGNLSTSSTASRFAAHVVNDTATGSKLVKLSVESMDGPAPTTTGSVYQTKALPGAASFAANSRIRISIAVPNAAGSGDAAGDSVTNLDVTVANAGDPRPASKLEMANRLAAAINQAVRDNAAAKMQGHEIEIRLVEAGGALHLTTSQGDGTATSRIAEAKITLAAPPGGNTFFDDYIKAAGASQNASRYRLGRRNDSSGQIITAQVAAGADGDDTGQPDGPVFKSAVTGLLERDPFFNLLCLPDLARPSAADPRAAHHGNAGSIYADAALLCQRHHAFLIVDPPPSAFDTGSAEAWKSLGFSFQSTHSAAFFPNIRVDDPLAPGSILSHPPSGAIAGLFARTDGELGVWTAPAGTSAVISGAYGPSVELSDADQGLLNPIAVNCIRKFPVFGTVNFGARTIDGANAAASEWKYIPVRRTASHILRSLSEGLRWAVHKPNGEELWGQLRLACTSFMQGLFRQGAFQGVSPREAFFVQCDASTTSPADMDQGIVNIVIGFAPLKVAEFVVISLRQKTGQSA